MRSVIRAAGLFAVALAGCAAVPPLENPVLVRPPSADAENPIVVAPGLPTPSGYEFVYDRCLDAVDDYFDLKPGSRFDGQIATVPRVAAGYEQPWKPGTPAPRERLIATFQTVRHTANVRIEPGERGGFRVYVEVYKELEDIARPVQAIGGAAAFRETPTVDRRIQAVGAVSPTEQSWIPAGRDHAFEQVLLRKIQKSICR